MPHVAQYRHVLFYRRLKLSPGCQEIRFGPWVRGFRAAMMRGHWRYALAPDPLALKLILGHEEGLRLLFLVPFLPWILIRLPLYRSPAGCRQHPCDLGPRDLRIHPYPGEGKPRVHEEPSSYRVPGIGLTDLSQKEKSLHLAPDEGGPGQDGQHPQTVGKRGENRRGCSFGLIPPSAQPEGLGEPRRHLLPLRRPAQSSLEQPCRGRISSLSDQKPSQGVL